MNCKPVEPPKMAKSMDVSQSQRPLQFVAFRPLKRSLAKPRSIVRVDCCITLLLEKLQISSLRWPALPPNRHRTQEFKATCNHCTSRGSRHLQTNIIASPHWVSLAFHGETHTAAQTNTVPAQLACCFPCTARGPFSLQAPLPPSKTPQTGKSSRCFKLSQELDQLCLMCQPQKGTYMGYVQKSGARGVRRILTNGLLSDDTHMVVLWSHQIAEHLTHPTT